jgi:methionine biosynthesis protein MetW
VFDLIPEGSKVLELGCSSGYFAEQISRKGCLVIGVDNDLPAIERCRLKGVQAYALDLASDAAEAVFAKHAPFDCIIAMDILEHLAAPESLLLRLHRHMHPRSQLIVTGPNVAYWHVRWQLLRGRWAYSEAGVMDETHLRWFTRASWRAMFRDADFVIEIDRVAEALLPKEFQLRRILRNDLIIDSLKRPIESTLPNVIATVFLFSCRSRRPGQVTQ